MTTTEQHRRAVLDYLHHHGRTPTSTLREVIDCPDLPSLLDQMVADGEIGRDIRRPPPVQRAVNESTTLPGITPEDRADAVGCRVSNPGLENRILSYLGSQKYPTRLDKLSELFPDQDLPDLLDDLVWQGRLVQTLHKATGLPRYRLHETGWFNGAEERPKPVTPVDQSQHVDPRTLPEDRDPVALVFDHRESAHRADHAGAQELFQDGHGVIFGRNEPHKTHTCTYCGEMIRRDRECEFASEPKGYRALTATDDRGLPDGWLPPPDRKDPAALGGRYGRPPTRPRIASRPSPVVGSGPRRACECNACELDRIGYLGTKGLAHCGRDDCRKTYKREKRAAERDRQHERHRLLALEHLRDDPTQDTKSLAKHLDIAWVRVKEALGILTEAGLSAIPMQRLPGESLSADCP